MRRPNVPVALRWLAAAVALAGVVWALVVPAWQVPDEDAHFAYVQTVAELHRRPVDEGQPLSSEQDLAERRSGFLDSAQRTEADPEWSAEAERRWAADDARLGDDARTDGGGENTAAGNPPGYYIYAAVPYLLARGGTVLDRLYATRLWSVPLLVLFAVSGWLLAGELLGRDRPLQLLAGAVCGLAPMATFVGVAVTPDALLFPLWGITLWLSIRALRRGRPVDLAWLALAVLAALAVKPVSAALLPGVLWAAGVGLWRRRRGSDPPARPLALGLAAAAALGAAAAVALVPGGPRRFASYLWQFYSPVQAGTVPIPQIEPWPLRDVWLEGSVAAFGWLEVRFPGWVYAAVAVALCALAIGGVRVFVAAGVRRHAHELVVLALPVAALVAGLHITEEWLLVREAEGFAQGRYLLPVLPLGAVVWAGALRALAPAGRRVAIGAFLGLLAAGQLLSIALVATRFYA
jgi:4-amino-4-deoxy-L-arabinose transferase-like glycosyltransferase